MSILREYQRQAVAAFWDALGPDVNRVAMEMATGLGKTITFAAVADEWLARQPPLHEWQTRPRVLVLVHTDELVRQAVDKIRLVTRGRWTVGVVKAERNEVAADIVVASVATLAKPERRDQITDVGLIIVDECHHAVAKSYRDILEHYGALPFRGHLAQDPPIPTLGVTATLARTDGQGLGRVWQELAFSRSLPWAIRKGFLVDLIPYTIRIPGVDAGASDAALDAQLAASIAPEAVVRAWAEKTTGMCQECLDAMDQVSADVGYTCLPSFCPNHPDGCGLMDPPTSTVLFAPLVRSAQAFADAFNAAGIKAEVIHGALPDAERRAVLERYEAGVTTVVCNAMVLTEGWDSPRTKCVIVARPTRSVPLFVQMVGRGLRPWLEADAPARENQRCVLLCVAGTTTDLVTVADLSDKIDEAQDGKSVLQMEDEWDIGKGLEAEEAERAWRGPVVVERWDALVRRSAKVWKFTTAGVPFLPTAKRGQGYVFIVETAAGWEIWAKRATISKRVATAPDLELAMAVAEDEAQERGGNIGALLADKTRAWRKGRPSDEAMAMAKRLGLGAELDRIVASKAGGKAGKLSDLIDKVTASRILDPIANKIKKARME